MKNIIEKFKQEVAEQSDSFPVPFITFQVLTLIPIGLIIITLIYLISDKI